MPFCLVFSKSVPIYFAFSKSVPFNGWLAIPHLPFSFSLPASLVKLAAFRKRQTVSLINNCHILLRSKVDAKTFDKTFPSGFWCIELMRDHLK